ncbi:MAG: hypothetical protein Q8K74_08305 [Candidatus Nitrotoga sp.]|nr:hypothetical protein [Candidatus Nitrotoga sp.]MDO9446525.1 hypothetical protein [Candidatus Nitrotoga sp.]MDP1638069.1 hypothetical protein [Candidatus Nitrotoga sp.]MDP1856035.1 hypothetical protein [Candidatus Nitrotoga sp.]MDP3497369.1 hypothetical protein [Candidatus Nitrotoga sp.]
MSAGQLFVSVLNRLWKYVRTVVGSQREFDDVVYKIAKEKHDGLTWDVNNKCLAVAKIDYGKWFGLEFVAMINFK